MSSQSPAAMHLQILLNAANERIAAKDAEIARLKEGLEMLSKGSTPMLDGYFAEAWECMAEYAKQLLRGSPAQEPQGNG
jgi:hypothetical protein